ncbi:MAG TPA: T9SS type A sorting domain-containing protein [Bacteroidales bacterium]|nr:T9SS type A sorting domain-containing protein [Bacteroidales bacterium]
MKNAYLIFCLMLSVQICIAQNFPEGTNAIHKDSSIIVSWAISANVERGYINIADTAFTYTESGTTSNYAWSGTTENVFGKADGQFISLGDGGMITLEFEHSIFDGQGYDFAVFENALFSPPSQTINAFVELAFVEVSSDGINFERFPSVSSCQYDQQINAFATVEWNLFENFAGIYPVFYGVPFDLNDIEGSIVNKNHITHIRLVDVVGSINPEYANYDSEGNIVNDAWPTPFATCGFDCDAVGVINTTQDVSDLSFSEFSLYPNPAKDFIILTTAFDFDFIIADLSGRIIKEISCKNGNTIIDISDLNSGIYLLVNKIKTQKFIKLD